MVSLGNQIADAGISLCRGSRANKWEEEEENYVNHHLQHSWNNGSKHETLMPASHIKLKIIEIMCFLISPPLPKKNKTKP